MRCTICEYMPRNLVSLCLCDGNEDRVGSWAEYEVVYGMVSAFGRLMSKERHIKILKMPSSFWKMPLLTFDYFVKQINEGGLEEIGFGDPFLLFGGLSAANKETGMFTPRVECLILSLTKSMVVDLRGCCYASERAERIRWAVSLAGKYFEFFKCERLDEAGKISFTFSKKHGCDASGDGREFEVKVVM
jgi:hypothetical protein